MTSRWTSQHLSPSRCGWSPRRAAFAAALGLVTAALLATASCGHTRPAWVQSVSRARVGDDGRTLYAVGVARGVRDPHQARTLAENRARLEIVKLLSPAAPRPRLLAATVAGTHIRELWVDGDGSVFALAVYEKD